MKIELKDMTSTGIRCLEEYREGAEDKKAGLDYNNKYQSFTRESCAYLAGYHDTKRK